MKNFANELANLIIEDQRENIDKIMNEVTRKIMSEVSGLPMSDVNFPEKLEYMSLIKGKKVKNT